MFGPSEDGSISSCLLMARLPSKKALPPERSANRTTGAIQDPAPTNRPGPTQIVAQPLVCGTPSTGASMPSPKEGPMDDGGIAPYALERGEGWTYRYGIDFTVKAGERGRGRRVAVLEYTTRRGEEPPEHTHDTEDEIFYVLQGALTFRCGEDMFEVDEGGFV